MKHILITGGSDGLGKVMAQKLKDIGYKITILSKDETKTAKVAKEIGCDYVVADVSDYEAVKEAFEKTGQVDILINNAGVWIQGVFDENDPELIKRTLEVNTLGTMYVSHVVIPSMKKRKQGRIINVISQAGFNTKEERVPYNASKWAITGFTKSLQNELKPFGISVVGFYPGALNNEALFVKSGNPRPMDKAMDLGMTAEAIAYICGLPDDVNVPELGILSMNY
jgi:NADP-dependent 3-hydroxy acid dehydrogenase YdfG